MFFAFSTDQSMVYEAARNLGVNDTKVDESGLIGKIWAGVSLTSPSRRWELRVCSTSS